MVTFAWEPNGEHFVVITTNDPNYGQPGVSSRTKVSFYYLEKPKHGKSGVANFKLISELTYIYIYLYFPSPPLRIILLNLLNCV